MGSSDDFQTAGQVGAVDILAEAGGYHLMTDRLVLSAKPNNILGSDTGSDDS